jgi:hypothetical protein
MEIENQFHQFFKLIGVPEFGSALQMPLSMGVVMPEPNISIITSTGHLMPLIHGLP